MVAVDMMSNEQGAIMPNVKTVVAVPAKLDQRTKVGLERREKMRKRLLTAIMSGYAQRESHVQLNIDDVTREAQVSRQTFYLYFTSLEDAVSKLGQEFADEMSFNMEKFSTRNHGPLNSLIAGILIFLLRSVTDPLWGAFVSRTYHLSKDAYLLGIVQRDLTSAREEKSIRFDDLHAATDFYVGSVKEGVGRLAMPNKHSRAYVEHFAVMVLLGLQVPYDDAKDLVQENAIYIRGLAPDCFPWWRDPWLSS